MGYASDRHRVVLFGEWLKRQELQIVLVGAPRAAGNRWQAQPRTTLSTAKNGIRFGLPRRNTMICCLSTRTSASSAARDRNRSTTKPKISLQRSHIQRRIVRFSADCQPDQIYDRDKYREHDRVAVQIGDARRRRSQIMSNLLDLLNKFIGAIIAYGPKNKTKARMARRQHAAKRFAAMKRD